MQTTRLMGSLLIAAALVMPAMAQDAPPPDVLKETAVLASLRQAYPSTTFKSVKSTQLPGIYEVVMGKNVAYVGDDVRYFLFGHLFDMKTQTDLTEGKKQDNVAKVDFQRLPLQDAVVTVRGDGTRKVAVFSDPDCPYCRQLENTLATVDNVTIYTFLFPIAQLHPQARAKTIAVWCATDRRKAWEGLMQRGETPSGGTACDHPIDRNIALAQSLGINGTPSVITTSGTLIPGAVTAARLEQLLNDDNLKVATK